MSWKLQTHTHHISFLVVANYHKLLKTREIYSLTILEARSLFVGLAPSGGSDKEFLPCTSPNFWLAASYPWLSLTCGCITPISAPDVTWLSLSVSLPQISLLCLIRSLVFGFRAHTKSRMILSQEPWLHLQRPFFQIRPHYQVPGVGSWMFLFGDTHYNSQHIPMYQLQYKQSKPQKSWAKAHQLWWPGLRNNSTSVLITAARRIQCSHRPVRGHGLTSPYQFDKHREQTKHLEGHLRKMCTQCEWID